MDKGLIQKLSDIHFTDDPQNVVLIGGPGRVEKHLLRAIKCTPSILMWKK